jgi:hypothetical protein
MSIPNKKQTAIKFRQTQIKNYFGTNVKIHKKSSGKSGFITSSLKNPAADKWAKISPPTGNLHRT